MAYPAGDGSSGLAQSLVDLRVSEVAQAPAPARPAPATPVAQRNAVQDPDTPVSPPTPGAFTLLPPHDSAPEPFELAALLFDESGKCTSVSSKSKAKAAICAAQLCGAAWAAICAATNSVATHPKSIKPARCPHRLGLPGTGASRRLHAALPWLRCGAGALEYARANG